MPHWGDFDSFIDVPPDAYMGGSAHFIPYEKPIKVKKKNPIGFCPSVNESKETKTKKSKEDSIE